MVVLIFVGGPLFCTGMVLGLIVLPDLAPAIATLAVLSTLTVAVVTTAGD